MDQRADGDGAQGKSVADFGSCVGTADYGLADFESVGCNDVGFCAVYVVKEGDAGLTVRIVLDCFYYGRYSIFGSLEVDDAVVALVAAAHVAVGQMAFGVTAAGGTLSTDKRFLWCISSGGAHDCLAADFNGLGALEYTNNFVTLARSSGLEFFYCHFLSDVAKKVD